MKNEQTPLNISLGNLIGFLREGNYVIPDFQRAFEWNPWDVNDLLKSIFTDYYIGTISIWEGKEEAAILCHVKALKDTKAMEIINILC